MRVEEGDLEGAERVEKSHWQPADEINAILMMQKLKSTSRKQGARKTNYTFRRGTKMVHEDEIVDFKNPSSGNYIIK